MNYIAALCSCLQSQVDSFFGPRDDVVQLTILIRDAFLLHWIQVGLTKYGIIGS